MLEPTDLLFPQPRRVRHVAGETRLDTHCRIVVSSAAHEAAEGLQRALGAIGLESGLGGPESGPKRAQLRLAVDRSEPLGPQGYRLSLESDGVDLVAADAAGLFYGGLTLAQWLRLAGRRDDRGWSAPRVEISDAPDFAARGFLLDISRNRVPRLDTLFELVELLSSLKLNQLQLYTEHTFAYRGHETVWRDASPLTDRDVRELDAFCRKRFVELVPNQNSFGHFHRWLSRAPYRELAECPEGLEHPFGLGREPFSLCPIDPRSLELLEDLYDQLLPNFSSRQVNVGLDETFDLGSGRSAGACAERGKQEVYLEFLRKVHGIVQGWGHRMQFWGDIILERPDLIAELPADVVALDWGYEADHPFEREARAFAEAGLDFYVCPGTSSWNSLGGRIDNALGNLASAASAGLRHGATGYLITDWGDNGHLQPLPISYPAIVAGAGLSWNGALAATPEALPIRDLLTAHVRELREPALVSAVMTLGSAHLEIGVTLKNSTVLFRLLRHADESLEHERFDRLESGGLDRALERLQSIDLPRSGSGLAARELGWVTATLKLACRLGRARLDLDRDRPAGALPLEVRQSLSSATGRLIDELPELWLARSRPGGLDDSRAYLERVRSALRA